MPRTLGAAASVVTKLAKAEAVYLMEFQFSGGSVYLNTGAVNLDWNGQTWVAVGGAIELDPVADTTDQQGQGLGVRLSGVEQSIIALMLTNGHRGRLANVWLAHLHAGTNLVLNPELQAAMTGWIYVSATFASVVRDTVKRAPGGGPTLKLTCINAVNAAAQVGLVVRNGGTAPSNNIPVAPDVPSTFSISLDLSQYVGTGAIFRLRMVPFTSADVQLTVQNGPDIIPELGWKRYSMTAVMPATTAKVYLRVENKSANLPLGDLWASEAKLEPGALDGEYLPGFDTTIVRGAVVQDPIPMGVYYMNEGFKVEETRGANGAEGSVVVSTRLISRLAVLSKQRGLRTNVDSHQALFAGDLFFKFVPTLTHKRIKWGS